MSDEKPEGEKTPDEPIVRDKRRIDPETGKVRQPEAGGAEHGSAPEAAAGGGPDASDGAQGGGEELFVEDILAAAEAGDDGFPAGAARKVRAAADYLALAPGAVRPRTDVPLDRLDDALPIEPRDPERLAELAAEFGVQASVERLRKAIAAALS